MNIIGRFTSRLQPFRVCMWHTGRCGSSVVADLLSNDGRIDWAGEILGPPSKEWSGIHGEEALDRCRNAINRRRYAGGSKPFGFELKLWHHYRLGLSVHDMRGLLRELGFGLHIVLERKNHLRQFVSGRVARKSGRYHRRAGEKQSDATVVLDLHDLMNAIEMSDDFYSTVRSALPDHLYLTYEDDIESDPTVAYAKVMRHCGMEPERSVTTNLRKTTARPLRDVIENYQETIDVLSGTRHEWMLDE